MSLIPYDFDGTPVRTITRDGEPWFVLADVCRVLEHSNPSKAAQALDEDERSSLTLTSGYGTSPNGGNPNVTIISEPGLYRLLMRSDKPQAKPFQKWVNAEVLPSIRKTGRYGAFDPMAALNNPATMRALLSGTTVKSDTSRRRGEIMTTGRFLTISGALNPVEKSQMTMVPGDG